MAEKQHFIVPVRMLMTVTIESTEDTLAEDVEAAVKKLQGSSDLRTDFYNWSMTLTERLEGDGTAMVIPGAFFSVKDQEEADTAVNFVTEFNERALQQKQQQETTAEEPKE